MFFRMVYKSGQIFLPFCHNTRVWQTDGQTDRPTDRILITIPRLHYMQRGKNVKNVNLQRTLCCRRTCNASVWWRFTANN